MKNSDAIISMRVPGFGPGLEAWEAPVIPLHYTRLKVKTVSIFVIIL
jgi:hypothetical protein